MQTWYKKSYLRNLVDMHIPDWNEEFLSKFDADNYADMLELSRVDTAIIYASSCLGICYWPAKVGHSHAALKGRDFLAETIAACRKKDLGIVVYYNIWSTWAYENHPEWRMRTCDGKTSLNAKWRSPRFGVCCPSSNEFLHYVLSQLTELLTQYEMDGMWIDQIGWLGLDGGVCCCDNCKKRYKDETGKDIPEIVDWHSPEWVGFQRKREEWLAVFTSEIRNLIKSHNPELSVTFQTATCWSGAVSLDFFKQCDYLAGDFNHGLLKQSFICKFFNNLSENRPIEYMAPRCITLQEHTTNKSDDFLTLNVLASFANNASFVFIDAIDPAGTLDPELYRKFGAWFKEMKKYEKYLDHEAELLADVAVFFNFESLVDPKLNGKHLSKIEDKVFGNYERIFNVTKTLIDQNIPFDIITNKNIKNLDCYQLLFLPDISVMDEAEAEAIREYVKKGGIIFSTRTTSLIDKNGNRREDFILSDLFGVSYRSLTKEWKTYLVPCRGHEYLFPECSERYPLSLNEKQVIVEAHEHATVLAKTFLPFLDPDNNACFSSAISDPPMLPTELPCCVVNRYGKGKSFYCAGGLDAMTFDKHRKVVVNLLRELCEKPFKFETNAPKPVEITVQHHHDHHRLIISMVNFQEELPNIPVHKLWVKLHLDGIVPGKLLRLPDATEHSHKMKNDFLFFEVPILNNFAMFALNYNV